MLPSQPGCGNVGVDEDIQNFDLPFRRNYLGIKVKFREAILVSTWHSVFRLYFNGSGRNFWITALIALS